MDFLFAPLPDTNFQMSSEQLRLWQRNAIFECECDNFINRQIEVGHLRLPNLLRRPNVEQTAIDAAIQQHGLGLRQNDTGSSSSSNRANQDHRQVGANISLAPFRQRPRLMAALGAEPERDSALDNLYQEAINTTFRMRGLGLMRNP